MDVINLLNLLNKNWGWRYFPIVVPSSSARTVGLTAITPAT